MNITFNPQKIQFGIESGIPFEQATRVREKKANRVYALLSGKPVDYYERASKTSPSKPSPKGPIKNIPPMVVSG